MPRSSLGLFWIGIPTLLAQAPTPATTIRVPVRLVTVPTLVFSQNGHLVPGLEKADFTVSDNGRRQNVMLDHTSLPVSVALAVQTNQDVRSYLPFIGRIGSVVDALIAGESGEAAVIGYNDEVVVSKPFDQGDGSSALRRLSAGGRRALMVDAGLRAVRLLEERRGARLRVLLLIGQPMDRGSESTPAALRAEAEHANISIYALTLPEFGRAFVSDTFSLEGLGKDRGGFRAGVDMGNLVSVLGRADRVEKSEDPFSILTGATGGTQWHFRKQKELEEGIGAIGVELRSAYLLSYSPSSSESGYHRIQVEVSIPGAKTHARPGYWLDAQ